MANKLHSSLTGADLHESKGAATAASGEVAVATGSGQALFQALSYNQLVDVPVGEVQFNGDNLSGPVKIRTYTLPAVDGKWSVTSIGLGFTWNIIATSAGDKSFTTVDTFVGNTATGTVYVIGEGGAFVVGGTQTVYVTFFGL